MSLYKSSEKLNAAADGKDLSEDSDSRCTCGYDNDGSTGLDIFENGMELVLKANGKEIWAVQNSDENAHFFIGSEDEVLERINQCPDEETDEDD